MAGYWAMMEHAAATADSPSLDNEEEFRDRLNSLSGYTRLHDAAARLMNYAAAALLEQPCYGASQPSWYLGWNALPSEHVAWIEAGKRGEVVSTEHGWERVEGVQS